MESAGGLHEDPSWSCATMRGQLASKHDSCVACRRRPSSPSCGIPAKPRCETDDGETDESSGCSCLHDLPSCSPCTKPAGFCRKKRKKKKNVHIQKCDTTCIKCASHFRATLIPSHLLCVKVRKKHSWVFKSRPALPKSCQRDRFV